MLNFYSALISAKMIPKFSHLSRLLCHLNLFISKFRQTKVSYSKISKTNHQTHAALKLVRLISGFSYSGFSKASHINQNVKQII